MHKKRSFFRRKLGSPQLTSNLETLPTSAKLADAALSHEHCKTSLGRDPSILLRPDTPNALVPTLPLYYRETDGPSTNVSSLTSSSLRPKSPVLTPSPCDSSYAPSESVLTSVSSSACSGEPTWHADTAVPSTLPTTPISTPFYPLHSASHQEPCQTNVPSTSGQCIRSLFVEPLLQPAGLRSMGEMLGSSNIVTGEQPPISSPPPHSRLPSLRATPRATVCNGEQLHPLSFQASRRNCASVVHSRSLSITRAGAESCNFNAPKYSMKSATTPSTTTSLPSGLNLITGTDQPTTPFGSSLAPRGPSVSFLDPTPSLCSPRIISKNQPSEDDKLHMSLKTWKLDQDGVLQGGSSSPTSSQTPVSLQSSFTLSASDQIKNLEQALETGDPELRSSHQVDSSSLKSLSSFFSAASDLNDSTNLYASLQDHTSFKPDHASSKTYPLTTRSNLPNSPPSDNPVSPSFHCLPSLVNPSRTAMQPRPPEESTSKSLACAAPVQSFDVVDSSRTAPSSCAPSSPTVASPSSQKSLLAGPPSPHPNFDASHYLTSSAATPPSPPLSFRASSLQQCPDPDVDDGSDAPVTKPCFKSKPDGDVTTPDLVESQCHVELSHSSRNSLMSSQPSTKTINRRPSQVASLKDAALVDDHSQVDQQLSQLSPSIRLVSPTTQASVLQSEISIPVPCAPNSYSISASASLKLSQSTPSVPPTPPEPTSPSADGITSSHLTGRASPIARINSYESVATKLVKRGGGGRGKQSTQQNNTPPSTLKIPQLYSCLAEKAHPTNYSSRPLESRSPRSHQSSPNLRNHLSPPLSDLPFFSVVASQPILPNQNHSPISLDGESENLNLPSRSVSCQSSITSVDLSASLIVPGMTVEENALRLAEMFWQEDETIVKQQKLTEWLGSPESNANRLQVLTRRAFVNRFDFKDLRIDAAFRKLCSKMYLKGETQQVDRILAEFSRRYWEQNQSNIYVNPDIVHALSYSILLLNTDLHVVDTLSRMSRLQFIRNTMETIRPQLSYLEFSEANRPKTSKDLLRSSLDTGEAVRNTLKSSTVYRPRRASINDMARTPLSTVTPTLAPTRPSMERWRNALRSGSQPITQPTRQPRSLTLGSSDDEAHVDLHLSSPEKPAHLATMDQNSSCDAIVSTSHASHIPLSDEGASMSNVKADKLTRAEFERELVALLKDIYTAIKNHPIAQSLAESHLQNTGHHGIWKRITSHRIPNSNATGERNAFSKRASLRGSSGLFAMLPVAPDGPSSRPNSPTPSSSLSTSSGMVGYSSNGGSSLNLTNFTTPSIGFVSNLSQSIIREQNEEELLELNQKVDEQTCNSKLALLGAPWAKEGILQRKQYWESNGKRHKDKSWAEVFVVIQEGTLQMFRFGQNTGSKRAGGSEAPKLNSDSSDQMAVGGGNWLPNAQLVGEICLSHALTSILVSGYSKDRTHVFVLTLSNGASYFFQTGTEELVHEWVSTCNYWAARLSKEPLTGGVSNMEYGWNHLLEIDLIGSSEKKEELQDCQREQEEMMSIGSGQSEQSHKARSHLRDRIFNGFPLGSSILSDQVTHSAQANDLNNWSTSGCVLNSLSISSHLGSATSSKINLDRHHARSSNISDKLFINEWNPPLPPTTLSTLTETAQMQNLKRHNSHIQMELEEHNQLRKPITNLYWNRPNHLQKAMANWEKKAQYLMAEIIKYTTYLNALEQTIQVKQDLTSAT